MGGDEARKTHWKECPLCQERMRQEGLEDEEALQGYFMARMSKYVQSKGKEAMGWDELTNTGFPTEQLFMVGEATVRLPSRQRSKGIGLS